ncbi:MAG TPA: hypothetical protein VG963_18995, partial [Polyangiaceae bacterium]|nr:hypothetical protein [Polyangiaceae bacterium]
MFRFIALLWDPANDRSKHLAEVVQLRLKVARPTWMPALQHNGAFVSISECSDSAGSVSLTHNRGVILGTIFLNDDAASALRPIAGALNDDEATAILNSRGRRLIEKYWGHYVAIAHERVSHETWVLRGPMAPLACFYSKLEDAMLCFSSVEDCVALGLQRFSINWDIIRAQAAHRDYLNHETAINEIRELLPGECIRVAQGRLTSTSTYWTPASVAKLPPIEFFDAASAALRSSTQRSVWSWGAAHSSALVKLSGGLDSSVVLGCLTQAPSRPRIVAVNHFSRQS